jgi:hypothetical protein
MEGSTEIPNQENIITPEVLETVFNKVQDIKEEGTAFLALGSNDTSGVGEGISLEQRLELVLKTGVLNPNLLGAILKNEGKGEEGEVIHVEGEPDLKKRGNIYFNIIGKSAKWNYDTEKWEEVKIENDGYLSDMKDEVDNIALIFDLDKFRSEREVDYKEFLESPEIFNEKREGWNWKNPPKSRAYTYNARMGSFNRALDTEIPFTSEGLPMADAGFGYVLANRIPPRFFKGLVLRPQEGNSSDILVKKVIEAMSLNSKPENLVPVYDIKGNLLWPKQLSHDEIIEMKKREGAQGSSI